MTTIQQRIHDTSVGGHGKGKGIERQQSMLDVDTQLSSITTTHNKINLPPALSCSTTPEPHLFGGESSRLVHNSAPIQSFTTPTNYRDIHHVQYSSSSEEDQDPLDSRSEKAQEVDISLLVTPTISRTQSEARFRTTASLNRRNSNASDLEDIEEAVDVTKAQARPAVAIPSKDVQKESRLGILASTAHRFTNINMASRFNSTKADSGQQFHGTTKSMSKKLPFHIPSFHMPHKTFGSGFLTNKAATTERKRSKTIVDNMPPACVPFSDSNPRSFGGVQPNQPCREPSSNFSELRRSNSQPSVLSYTSSVDDAKFATVQSMTNSRLKAIKDNFQGLSPEFSIASAKNALSNYANSINSVLTSSSLSFTNSAAQAGAVPSTITPLKPHPLDTVAGDIVVLGGYRGSILREASTKRRVWIPLKVGLGVRKVNLEVGFNPEDELRAAETIVPDGMLTHIGPVDFGRRLLRRLRSGEREPSGDDEFGRRVFEYGYDWRLSLHVLSAQLISFLEKLPCNHNYNEKKRGRGRGALVIAHSLGGLVTRHAMNERPELFSGVLFAGTPQHCVNILGPLRNGDTVLFSSKVLTAQVNFSFRSSFALLPESGRCFIDRDTGKHYPMDFFDSTTWIKYALSPCVAPQSSLAQPQTTTAETVVQDIEKEMLKDRTVAPQMVSGQSSISEGRTVTISLSEARQYLERTLKETKKFKSELAFRQDIHDGPVGYPPQAVLYANNTPTVKGAKISGLGSITTDDVYDTLVYGAGDGVCLAKAAQLPSGYTACAKVLSERGHISLLGDLDAVGQALEAVVKARGW